MEGCHGMAALFFVGHSGPSFYIQSSYVEPQAVVQFRDQSVRMGIFPRRVHPVP